MFRRQMLLLSLALLAPLAQADALDDVMAKKSIAIAVPTDFPPYGFVATDLKPQGLDVDMAGLIANAKQWRTRIAAIRTQ